MAQLSVEICNETPTVVLLQEPYVVNGEVRGIPLSCRVVSARSGKAAIVVTDPAVDLLTLHLTSCVVAVELRDATLCCLIISVYAPPSVPLENILDEVSPLLSRARGPVVIGGDFNAKSPQWGSLVWDGRGSALSEFAEGGDLCICNDPASTPTFCGPRGNSWIDVTMATASLATRITNWRVSDEESCSDHRYIKFDLGKRVEWFGLRKYSLRFVNWARFRQAVVEEVSDWSLEGIESGADLDERVEVFTRSVLAVCDRQLRRRAPQLRRSVPWWTSELSIRRKRVNAMRRRYQRTHDHMLRKDREVAYRCEAARYKRCISEAKRRSWEAFCDSVTAGNPFSLPYRLSAGKQAPFPIIAGVRRLDGSMTQSLPDTIDELFERLFPQDVLADDDEEQSELRRRCREAPPTQPDFHFTEPEVLDAIAGLPKGKAPGVDGLSLEIWGAVTQAVPHLVVELYNRCLELKWFPSSWKLAKVVMFCKAGKAREEARSYRPICLLPVAGKVLDRLLTQRILHHLHRSQQLGE